MLALYERHLPPAPGLARTVIAFESAIRGRVYFKHRDGVLPR
jgi:hypothetical protein